ncbi:hypothetical protein DSO57_1025403 [Entomophthora muscae]|uniref:Uncharacterized protein n=1 Tax=Entomophthora muscae TaxID=34485 RepID=A0ACC2TPE2_9FUNG|nr:hypothetical protein DSO57_1025403 [Entomophthora muscae]
MLDSIPFEASIFDILLKPEAIEFKNLTGEFSDICNDFIVNQKLGDFVLASAALNAIIKFRIQTRLTSNRGI